MKCIHCQGEMMPGIAPLHIDRGDIRVSLDNLAALVCAQCGEVYFEEAEVNAVQEIIYAVDLQKTKLARTV